MEEIANALGIMRKGVLVYDTEDVMAVHTDCCLHDWIRDGRNLITKYSLDHPASPGTDEEFLLRAHQQAQFRILIPESVAPGAGLKCADGLSDDRLFLMDLALSNSVQIGQSLMATRTVPLDGYWMTTGAGLPISDRKIGEEVARELRRLLEAEPPVDPHKLALAILRKCLDCGAAEYVTYSGPEERVDLEESETGFLPAPKPATSRRVAGRNDPCPCGSGKKYKKCHGRQPSIP
jgi:hypothetical protein